MPFHRLCRRALLLCCLLMPAAAASQNPPFTPAPGEAVRVFLDCIPSGDFEPYPARDHYVNWVRDRADAGRSLIISSKAPRGAAVRPPVHRAPAFVGSDDEILFPTQQTDTEDECAAANPSHRPRAGSVRVQGQFADRLQLSFTNPAGTSRAAQQPKDPWNLWVFEVGRHGFSRANRSPRKTYLGIAGSVAVSEKWKSRPSSTAATATSRITRRLDPEDHLQQLQPQRAPGPERWDRTGLGPELTGERSTRDNYDLRVKVGPGSKSKSSPTVNRRRRQFVFFIRSGLITRTIGTPPSTTSQGVPPVIA